MGWYYLAQDYYDKLSEEQKKCVVCGKKLEVDRPVYFEDFANKKVLHFRCIDNA